MTLASWRSCAIAGLLAVPLLAQAPSPAPAPLQLRYATFDPTLGLPSVPPALRAGDDLRLWVVQLRDRPTDAMRASIVARGGELHGYLPQHAYVVRMDAAAAVAVHRAPQVRWVGHYEPAWRLEPELVREHVAGITAPVRRFHVVVVDKHRDKPALAAAVARIGGRVHSEEPGSILFTVDLDQLQLLQVARLDQVLWIQRATERELDMNNARQQGGGAYVETTANYRGQGVRGHIYEGIEIGHPDFTNTPTVVQSCGSADPHGHCTGGIVFGNGTSASQARGMAPDAVPFFTNYSCENPGTSRWLVVNELVGQRDVMFTTASWGNARTLSYDAISADSDDIVFDHDIPWTQSQSNAGNRMSRPQAWAKNVISIGGVQHFDDSNPANDSWRAGGASIGPAADGRIKPDLCAYYDSIWCSDLSGSSGYSSGNSYTNFGGTSGATPIVAGHVAIALQMFTDGLFGNTLRVPNGTRFQNRPHFSTLKALMVASATQYPFNASSNDNLRVHQGYGFPSLRRMYDQRQKMFVADEPVALTQNQSHAYTIRIAASEPELRVTMVYADPAGNPAGGLATNNDLSLKVTDPNGTVYWGNQGLATGNWSTSGGSANTIDTVESVFLQNPVAGDWTVEVVATLVVVDGHVETPAYDADFGLVVIGGVRVGGGGGGGTNCVELFVPDNDPATGSCNNVPFGTTASVTSLANQRYQTVIPAGSLGGQSLSINGLAFAPCGSGLRMHDTIRIQMSLVPAGYALTTSFAANLPSPVVVLDQRNYGWNSQASAWTGIGLEQPFQYDGTSDVVVDITVTGSDFVGSGLPEFRRGNNPRLHAAGWSGSPPATGTLASFGALKMRLQSACAQIGVFGRGCSTLTMSSSGDGTLGGTFTAILNGAAPGSPAFLNFGLTNSGPLFPFDLTLVGVPGCYLYHDPIATASVPTNGSGTAQIPLQTPNVASLTGAKLFISGMQVDSAHPGGVASSDYLRIVLGQ